MHENWSLLPEGNINFNILLTDRASGYPQAHEDLGSSNLFLFSNMALLIQSMMQGVITTLKAYYIRKMCDRLVKGTKNYKMTIRSTWRALTVRNTIMQLVMHEEKSLVAVWMECGESYAVSTCLNSVASALKKGCPSHIWMFWSLESHLAVTGWRRWCGRKAGIS